MSALGVHNMTVDTLALPAPKDKDMVYYLVVTKPGFQTAVGTVSPAMKDRGRTNVVWLAATQPRKT